LHINTKYYLAFTQAASLLNATTNTSTIEPSKVQGTSSTVAFSNSLANLPLDQQYEILKSVTAGEIVINPTEEKTQEVHDKYWFLRQFHKV